MDTRADIYIGFQGTKLRRNSSGVVWVVMLLLDRHILLSGGLQSIQYSAVIVGGDSQTSALASQPRAHESVQAKGS